MRYLAKFAVAIALVALTLGMTTCSTAKAAGPTTITIDGSTTVGPIVKAFAEYTMQHNPNLKIVVSESGSGNGAKSLTNSTCDIAAMSRFMKDKEFAVAVSRNIKPVPHVIAVDGLAVIVHPSNRVKGLTLQQVKDIYTGKIKNWSKVGGANRPIVKIGRDNNSGTFETFNKLVMKKTPVASSTEIAGSNGAIKTRVQKTQAAIGYVGLGFVDRTVKPLTVNKIKPTAETISSGVYPIARPLFLFTSGYPKLGTPLHAFVTFHLSETGQEIIESIGFIPTTSY